MKIFTHSFLRIFLRTLFVWGFFSFYTIPQSLGQTETRTFNTSGNFQVPHGVTSIEVRVWGAGGGGGFTGNNRGAGAGGGGGFTLNSSFAVTPGSTIP